MNEITDCPKSLRDLQRSFAALVLEPERLETQRGRATLRRLLDERHRVDPSTGMHVYTGGYPSRIREALADTFEAVVHIVGDDAFTALCARYATARRPTSYNLNDAGQRLPRYLRRMRHDPLAEAFPFLADLAELEWKTAAAFHAAVQPPIEPATLADWSENDWTTARLELQPGVGLVTSRWPVLSIWELRHSPRTELRDELEGGPESVLVFRRDSVVRLERISRAEADAIESIRRGRRLLAVLERAALRGASSAEVGSWFARWRARGLVVGCVTGK